MAQVMKNNNFVYELDEKIYFNLTNACTNDCVFCIRSQKDDVKGTNMLLDKKANFEAVISQLEDKKSLLKNGVTFCGYGEPLLEKDLLIRIAKYIKQFYPDTYIKINTNGHANAVYKKNIIPELKSVVDEISISYNAQNEKLYDDLCMPKITNAYEEMKKFAQESVNCGIKTTMTVVGGYKDFPIDIEECKKFAKNIGANFRERPFIENGY